MLKNQKEILETIENARKQAQKDLKYIDKELYLQNLIIKQAISHQEVLKEKNDLILFYQTKIDIIYNYLYDNLSEKDLKENE